jgi:HK97 family phage major capsid protein
VDLEALQQRLLEINEQANDLRSQAEAEKRDVTEDEAARLDALLDESDRVARNIERLERLQAQTEGLRRGTGRKTAPDAPANQSDPDDPEPPAPRNGGRQPLNTNGNDHGGRTPPPRVPAEVRQTNGGFRSLGDFALAVRVACCPGGQMDRRLERLAPTTWAGESSGEAGGYMVPADFRTAVMTKIMGEASLLPRTDQITISGNTLTIPRDTTAPWSTSGIRAYWGSEGALKTQSRPGLDTMSLRLHKVYALVPVTDELAEDAPAMDSFLRRKAPEAIDFAINLAILQGTGSNQPLGVLNSPALVTVAKETSQLADTLVALNVIKMWSRLYAGNRSTAIWSVHQDVETMLHTMSLPGRDNTGAFVTGWGTHVYMPAGGLSGSPYATLFGRPVIPTQACETLGDLGDIILWDPQAYLSVLKAGTNPRVDVSMHLWFDYDVTAYRFVLRMTGQPWWEAAVSPRDGSNTLSPYVTLAERG